MGGRGSGPRLCDLVGVVFADNGNVVRDAPLAGDDPDDVSPDLGGPEEEAGVADNVEAGDMGEGRERSGGRAGRSGIRAGRNSRSSAAALSKREAGHVWLGIAEKGERKRGAKNGRRGQARAGS